MKVAFVVQRYGLEVNGGSEYLCRSIAEKMKSYWDLEVLTSCAVDYTTWENHYPSGVTQVNQVKVRRFKVDYPRTTLLFNQWSDLAFHHPVSRQIQDRWMREQGPYSSEYIRFLQENGSSYDVVFFFTYLYAFTWFGLPLVADRSILVPTAHDEPSFHLPIFRELFSKPQAFLFQTPEEQKLVLDQFHLSTPNDVVSTGIDLPHGEPSDEDQDVFRTRIQGNYILYLGRIEESKGCRELFEYFLKFKERNRGLQFQLVLAGKAVMEIPQHPDIIHLGFVTEEFKNYLLARAQVLVMPSPYESLSLVTLEAWAAQTPVLVNRRSVVLQGQCERSQGGWVYGNFEEFEKGLTQLIESFALRRQLGMNGFQYVSQRYLWGLVEKNYLTWAQSVASHQGYPQS